MGSSGEHSTDFPALALHPWDHKRVVPGRLMPHPGDYGGFGPLLDRDALRSGDCPGANGRGMNRDSTGEPVGKINVILMKAQERHHRPVEILDVLSLGLVTASGVGLLLLGKPLRQLLCQPLGVV